MERQQYQVWKYIKAKDIALKKSLQRNFNKPMDQFPAFPEDVLEPWVESSSRNEEDEEDEIEEETEAEVEADEEEEAEADEEEEAEADDEEEAEEEQETAVEPQLRQYQTRSRGRR